MKLLKQQHFLIGAVTAVLVAGFAYTFIRLESLNSKLKSLAVNVSDMSLSLASTTAELENNIAETHNRLNSAIYEERQNVGSLEQRLGHFQNQVGSITGTVSTLQKLSKTDPELLKKYSKVYFLNDNYIPARLSQIPLDYQYSDAKQLIVHTDVLPHLLAMINAATSSGIKLYVSSAYRSFAEQKALKGDYKVVYGAGTANSFSADQGYSEHQLGTALDMITTGLGGSLDGFDQTKAYQWMVANAYKYGFVISYPKNNNYYIYEPWHWRYVGVKLATDLHNLGRNFYDMDQRVIDEYLVSIFD